MNVDCILDNVVLMINFLNVASLTRKRVILFLGNNTLKSLGVKSHSICILFPNVSEKCSCVITHIEMKQMRQNVNN